MQLIYIGKVFFFRKITINNNNFKHGESILEAGGRKVKQ